MTDQSYGNWQKYQSKNPAQQMFINRFLAQVRALVAPLSGASILDAGCGEGFVLDMLLRTCAGLEIAMGVDIDEEALLAALERGKLGSAALDVFEGEPKLNPRFLKLQNVLLQPHHASGTFETRKAMGKLLRDNLTAHFDGRPLPTPVL